MYIRGLTWWARFRASRFRAGFRACPKCPARNQVLHTRNARNAQNYKSWNLICKSCKRCVIVFEVSLFCTFSIYSYEYMARSGNQLKSCDCLYLCTVTVNVCLCFNAYMINDHQITYYEYMIGASSVCILYIRCTSMMYDTWDAGRVGKFSGIEVSGRVLCMPEMPGTKLPFGRPKCS